MSSPLRGPRVIIHADDFGHSAPATQAITACIDLGVITSVSILANMPGTTDGLLQARRFGDRASVGVHLNLSEGRPLTDAPSLVDRAGVFFSRRSVILRALFRTFRASELERELTSQVAHVRDAGVVISHLDGHKHLHLVPGIAHLVVKVARRFGLERIRCPIRSPVLPSVSIGTTAAIHARTWIATLAKRQFDAAHLRHPDRLVDLRHVYGAPVRHIAWQHVCLRAGLTEIMCHPSDAAFLQSEEFSGFFRASGAVSCTYWDC